MPAASASSAIAGEGGVPTPAASRLCHKDGGGGGGSSDDEDETPLGPWLQGAAFPSNGSVASSGHDRFDLAQRTFSTLKHEWITAAPGGDDLCDQQSHAPSADAAMARTYAWVEATLTALGFSEEVLPVNAPADDSLGLEQPTADGDVSLVTRPPRRAYCAARESVSLAAAAAMLLASAPHRHHHCPDSALVQARVLSAAFTAPAHQQQRDPDCDDDGGGRVSVLALGVSVLFCVALECECLEEAVGMLEPELRYLVDAQRAISRAAHHHSTAGTTSSASVAVLAVHGSPGGSAAGSPNAAVTGSSRSPPPQLRCLVGDPRSTVAAERQYRRVALTAAMATLVYSTGHATTSRSSRKTARGNGSSRGANQGGGGGGTAQQHQRSNSGAADRLPLLGSQAQSPGHTAAPSPRDGASPPSPKHPHAASNGHAAAFPGANDSTSSAAASLGFAGASHGGMPFMDGGSMIGGVAPTAGGGGSFANSFTHNTRNFGSDSVATRPSGAGPGGASSSARPHPLASPFGAASQAGTARQYLGFTPTGDCLSERAAVGAPTLAGAQCSLVTDGVAGSWGRSPTDAGTQDTGTTPGAHSLTNAALMGLGPPARSPVTDTWHMRGGDAAGRGGSDPGGASSPRTMNPMRQGQIGSSGSPTTPAPPAELPPGSGHTHPGGSATSAGADTAAHRQEFVRQIGVAVTGLLLSGRSAGHSSLLAKRSALHAAAAAGYHWHAAPTILAAIAREADEGSIGPDVTKGLWYAPDTPGACIAPALRTRLSLPREMHFSSVVVVAAPPDQLADTDPFADADPTASARVDSEAARPPTGRSLRALRSGQESLRLTPKGLASSQASHRTRRSTRGSVNGPLPAHRGGSAVALECSTEILNHPDGGDRAEGDDATSHRTQPTRREAKYRVKNPADLPPEEQDARKCCAGGCVVA